MFKVLMVGIGGLTGAISRYLAGNLVNSHSKFLFFPLGTFFVNMVGCFFIGAISQLVLNREYLSPELEALILIGFLGSFTTYSTFSNETLGLIQNGKSLIAFFNIGFHIFIGIIAVISGQLLIDYIFK